MVSQCRNFWDGICNCEIVTNRNDAKITGIRKLAEAFRIRSRIIDKDRGVIETLSTPTSIGHDHLELIQVTEWKTALNPSEIIDHRLCFRKPCDGCEI